MKEAVSCWVLQYGWVERKRAFRSGKGEACTRPQGEKCACKLWAGLGVGLPNSGAGLLRESVIRLGNWSQRDLKSDRKHTAVDYKQICMVFKQDTTG